MFSFNKYVQHYSLIWDKHSSLNSAMHLGSRHCMLLINRWCTLDFFSNLSCSVINTALQSIWFSSLSLSKMFLEDLSWFCYKSNTKTWTELMQTTVQKSDIGAASMWMWPVTGMFPLKIVPLVLKTVSYRGFYVSVWSHWICKFTKDHVHYTLIWLKHTLWENIIHS